MISKFFFLFRFLDWLTWPTEGRSPIGGMENIGRCLNALSKSHVDDENRDSPKIVEEMRFYFSTNTGYVKRIILLQIVI